MVLYTVTHRANSRTGTGTLLLISVSARRNAPEGASVPVWEELTEEAVYLIKLLLVLYGASL